MQTEKKFFQKFLDGEADRDDFFTALRAWHGLGKNDRSLYDDLGMIEDDYLLFVHYPERLDSLKKKYAATGSSTPFLDKLQKKHK
jgi:hypothetical protein